MNYQHIGYLSAGLLTLTALIFSQPLKLVLTRFFFLSSPKQAEWYYWSVVVFVSVFPIFLFYLFNEAQQLEDWSKGIIPKIQHTGK